MTSSPVVTPPSLEPRIVRLAGGRALAFTELGDPDGFPVVNCHGGLIGRLDVRSAHAAAVRRGVWLLSPDRPGVGASDALAERTILDWPDDVAALADLVGFERFGVLGWSMGVPYAAACAFRLGPRVTRAALVAGCPPLDEPATYASLNRMDRAFTVLARRAPAIERLLFASMGVLASRAPQAWARLTARSLPACDAAVVRADPVGFARAQAEVFATPAGLVEEYDVWARPWGFRLEDIAASVDVWQGDHDTLVPPAWAVELATRIPGAERHDLTGAGHFLAPDDYDAVLERLLP